MHYAFRLLLTDTPMYHEIFDWTSTVEWMFLGETSKLGSPQWKAAHGYEAMYSAPFARISTR